MEEKAPLPSFFEVVAPSCLETDQVEVVNFRKYVLRFVMSREKNLFVEEAAGGHADPRRPALSGASLGRWMSARWLRRDHRDAAISGDSLAHFRMRV